MRKDPYKYFRVEARELLDVLSRGLLELERSAEPAVVERLLRAAHTLKGAARVVGATEIGDVAHALEDELHALGLHSSVDVDALLTRLDLASAHLTRLTGEGAQVSSSAHALGRAGARIDVEALDAIANDLHELRGLVRSGDDGEIADRRFRALLERVESLRLVRVDSIVVDLERAIRDASMHLSKKCAFVIRGDETRLDTRVFEAVRPALLHLVRNAVAHGIETPDVRRERGKPLEGTVDLSVRRRGSRIVFELRDDGAGVDRVRLAQAAGVRGDSLPQSDDELLQYLLHTNVSTSDLTQISGRGVGLDVVRHALSSVDGSIRMATSGAGTTFTLDLPVSLASMRGLVVNSGAVRALIPLHAVRSVASTGVIGASHVEIDDVMFRHVPLAQLMGTRGTSRVAVVVESRGESVAVGIDSVHGVRDHVTHSLPVGTTCSPLVVGACIDEGVVQLVLSPRILVQCDTDMALVAQPPESRPVRVLVVDDSVTTRMLEKSILESAGFEVEIASSGEEGLDMVRSASFDALVVDVEMPGMSGFELVETIRADPKLGLTPIILVTSLAEPDHVRRGEAVGANGYLIKSEFNQDMLLRKLRFLTRASEVVA